MRSPSAPIPHFPWRHSPDPPARFRDADDLSGMPNNWRGRTLRRMLACRELGITPLESLKLPFGFTHQWEDELGSNFATAFKLGLAELISRAAFRGRLDVEQLSEDDDDHDDKGAYLNAMFDERLLEKYRSFDSDADDDAGLLRVRLSVRPIEARLQHIFVV